MLGRKGATVVAARLGSEKALGKGSQLHRSNTCLSSKAQLVNPAGRAVAEAQDLSVKGWGQTSEFDLRHTLRFRDGTDTASRLGQRLPKRHMSATKGIGAVGAVPAQELAANSLLYLLGMHLQYKRATNHQIQMCWNVMQIARRRLGADL